jgi:threonine/homoserine/homoserine lactone efflux protein
VIGHVAAFVALSSVIVAVPGPAVMLVVKSTLLRSRRAAMLVAVGVLCGDLIWAAAAVGGITALIVASRPAFEVLRFAGAAYLVYLGLRLLLARGTQLDVPPATPAATGRSSSRSFGEGLLCELSNPKALIVFTSVIPQFVSHDAPAGEVAVFGVLFAVLGFVALATYATVLGLTRRAVPRRRLREAVLRTSGGLLMLFGVGLVVDRSG